MTKNTTENTPTQAPADRDALIEFRARVHHSHVSAGRWEDMPGGYLSNMLAAARATLEAEEAAGVVYETKPIPMVLHCPVCRKQHVDEGEWSERPHRSHECQNCGCVWRPCDLPTVGVVLTKTAGLSDWSGVDVERARDDY